MIAPDAREALHSKEDPLGRGSSSPLMLLPSEHSWQLHFPDPDSLPAPDAVVVAHRPVIRCKTQLLIPSHPSAPLPFLGCSPLSMQLPPSTACIYLIEFFPQQNGYGPGSYIAHFFGLRTQPTGKQPCSREMIDLENLPIFCKVKQD